MIFDKQVCTKKGYEYKKKELPYGDFLVTDWGTDIILEGSKGCFAEGTLIQTPDGFKKIEDIKPNDIVLTYPWGKTNWNLKPKKVIETLKHDKDSNNAKLLLITHEKGQIKVTENHWFLTINNDYKEIGSFEINDFLIMFDGSISKILEIKEIESESTYTFMVEDYHTYIANGIRVHNKGGGKGGSANRAPVEAPNTLQSKAIARVILAYSEGETGGLVDGAKSIYFDDTPLQDSLGNFNFSGVTWTERFGLPTQPYVPGFEQSSNVRSINVQVIQSTPVIRTVTDSNVDAVRVIIRLPRLQKIDSSTGDQTGTSVSFSFAVKDPSSGIWESRGTKTISGKTTTPYQVGYRIEGPSLITNAWDIKITRITADSTSNFLFNDIFFDQMIEINDGKETYPNTAYIAIEVDTEQFGNNIPQIALKVDGIKVPVPSNYNQTNMNAPFYTGIWDGTFVNAVTPNPIWHLYAFLTNTTFGMGIDPSFIDKFEFYQMAQYCDAVDPSTGNFIGVDDGASGLRRRFTLNTQILRQEEAFTLLGAIISSARGMLYFGAGVIAPSQDSPKSPLFIATNENVQEGKFVYSSTEAKDRITIATVTYNDKDDFYRVNNEVWPPENTWSTDTNILRYGKNIWNGIKYGCNNRAEAQAFAKWVVYSSLNETETVNFVGGPDFANARPGDIIEVYDRRFASTRLGGRIVNGTLTSVTLDAPVTLTSGNTYTITIIDADGKTLETRNIIDSAGTYTTVNVDSSFSNIPTTKYIWGITGTDVAPRPFRVLSNNRKSMLEYEIFALFYDSTKFSAVESGIVLDQPKFTRINVAEVSPVSNIGFTVQSSNDPILGSRNDLLVTWTESVSEYAVRYRILYRFEDNIFTEVGWTSVPEIIISNVQPGKHEVIIYAVSISGRESASVTAAFTWTYGGSSTLLPPVNLSVKGGGTSFTGKDLNIIWSNNPSNDNSSGEVIRDYQIEVFDSLNNLLRTEYSVDTNYTYTFTKNEADGGPRRTINITIKGRDSKNKLTSGISATFTNPAPNTVTATILGRLDGGMFINIDPVFDLDLSGYIVWRGTSTGFTINDASRVYIGNSPIITLDDGLPNTTYYFKIAAYDAFSSDPSTLNLTTELSANTGGQVDLKTITFSDLIITPNDPSTNSVSWQAFTAESVENNVTQTTNVLAGNAAWTSGILYLYFLDGDTTLNTTTNIVNAVGKDKRIVAQYKGGTDLIINETGYFIDGGRIIASTIGAAQLVTGTAVITETAQIADAIITGAKIGTATIVDANIANAAITTAKIADAAITTAKIGNAQIQSANIADLTVDTIKIKDGAITSISSITNNTNQTIGTYNTIASMIVTVQNSKALFLVTVDVSNIKGTSEIFFRIMENGIQISSKKITVPIADTYTVIISRRDNDISIPGNPMSGGTIIYQDSGFVNAGKNTYDLQIYEPNTGQPARTVKSATLTLMEVKK